MRFDVKNMTEEELQSLCEKYRSVQSGVSSDDYFRALNELKRRESRKNVIASGGEDVFVSNPDYAS